MTVRKFNSKKLFRPYRAPNGFKMPKPRDLKPSRPMKDKRQLSLFEEPKRIPTGYVKQPLTPHLAALMLDHSGGRLEREERVVLLAIQCRLTLRPQQRAMLNRIFAKLETRT